MKKQILIAALGFVSMGSFAQTLQEKPVIYCHGNMHGIPTVFTKNAKPYLEVEDQSEEGDITYYLYDENLSLVKSYLEKADESVIALDYIDCSSAVDGRDFYFSQQLFNDDEAFEYVKADKNMVNENSYYSTYMSVMSDDGKELTRVTFDKPVYYLNYIHLVHIGEKNYIVVSSSYYDSSAEYGYGENFVKIYLINKATGGEVSIREVEQSEGLRAFPSFAGRNQSVNIELGSNSGNHLQVTSANGSVVRQMPIREGQTSVQLNTRGLSAGLYVVSTVNKDGTHENCKIVIR